MEVATNVTDPDRNPAVHPVAAGGFAAAAPTYARIRPTYARAAIGAIKDLVPAGAVVLDVAAGTGILAGQLRPLAYTGSKRASFLPDVPTMAEAGVRGVELDHMSWYGMFAPAKTPPKIIAFLHRQVVQALDAPAVAERLRTMRLEPGGGGPEEFRAFLEAQFRRFAEIVKIAGVEPQ